MKIFFQCKKSPSETLNDSCQGDQTKSFILYCLNISLSIFYVPSPRDRMGTGICTFTRTSMSVHNGFKLWTLILLFNFIRFVSGEQVDVPAHLLSYADFAVEIYSTSTPFRVLAL